MTEAQRKTLALAAKIARQVPVDPSGTAFVNLVDGGSFMTYFEEIPSMIAAGKVESACTLGYVMMAQGNEDYQWFVDLWDAKRDQLSLPMSYHIFALTATQDQMVRAFENLARVA